MRPFDDIVVEEFISNLPGPTIQEVGEPMEPASGPAKAPAYSPSGEMAGDTKQEPDSSAPMETDAPEGSSFEEGSGVKVEKAEQTTFEPVADPDDVRMDDAGDTGDHATGSSPSGEAPMPGCQILTSPPMPPTTKTASTSRASGERLRHAWSQGLTRQRPSPLMKLAEQIHGYGQTGLYHDNIRLDKINSFKVQHMYFRQQAPPHVHMKFNFAEEDLMEQVCTIEPICYRRSTKLDVVFRAGDYQSTLDDREMARASAAREEALELNHMLLERLRELNKGRRSASREELMNAMLHYFLAAGVDDDELGDLSLERMPKPIGPAEEGTSSQL